MHVYSLRAFRVAAFLGFLAVALGAFGAHGMEAMFAARPEAREWWGKAVLYQAIHSTVMLLLSCLRPFAATAWGWFGAGVILFCGSLYLAAAGGPHWLVHVTPMGGLCFLVGWLWLVLRPISASSGEKGETS